MKIFVLLSRFPYPLEKGDKLRAYNQIKQLSKNHEIHLCALSDIAVEEKYSTALDPYCKSVTIINIKKPGIAANILKAFVKGKPLQAGYFYSNKAQKIIDGLIDDIKPDHIFCQLIRVAEYVKNKNIPKTIDYQDVFSKGVERRSHTASFYLKPVLKSEYKRLLKYENEVFDLFDNKTIISIPDRDLIPHPDKEKIEVVINGVDTDFFKPMKSEKEYDLVFTGNMGYPPNVNASLYLANEILPVVRRQNPDITLILAGASPHPDVKALESNNIRVTGWVEDIREYYAKARIFIAPMQIGTGLQNKLLEAMAMKIPSITSPLANSALEAKPGKEILIGNNPKEFADHIIRLLEDKKIANELAEQGYLFVQNKYNWESATHKLEELIVKK
jgi:sugar transferase (PEP-CTERM/EpsH1 system associated)